LSNFVFNIFGVDWRIITTMQLVEKHVINKFHKYWSECDQLCLNSNIIRNQGLYIQREARRKNLLPADFTSIMVLWSWCN
ncbi:MAG: hypothetical protein AAF063_38300, partial [Cyanobacteria bacterium J06643_5]